jgi:hypothetical protein
LVSDIQGETQTEDIKGGTQTEGVCEQGAEENIWTEEGLSDR